MRCPLWRDGSRRPVDRRRDQVVLQVGGPTRRTARPGRPKRRARGCHCGGQDREPAPVGLRSVPLGGPGGRVLAGGAGGDEGTEDSQGDGGELTWRESGEGSRPAKACCPRVSIVLGLGALIRRPVFSSADDAEAGSALSSVSSLPAVDRTVSSLVTQPPRLRKSRGFTHSVTAGPGVNLPGRSSASLAITGSGSATSSG